MFPSRIATLTGGDVFRNEYSLEFDGSNDYVDAGDLGVNANTVSVWFKPNSTIDKDTSDQNLLNIGGADYEGIMFGSWTGVITNEIISIGSASARTGYADASASISASWHHFVMSWDSGNSKYLFYLDGVELTTTSGSGSHVGLIDANEVKIGTTTDNAKYFTGKIDEVAIWNTALTSSQVKTLYNNREPFNAKNIALSNLKGYWRMGDGVLDDFGSSIYGLISDNVTPSLGAELWDAGADIFTSGTYAWEEFDDNGIANVSNELEITYEDNSEGAKIGLRNSKDLNDDLTINQTYKLKIDAYYSGGSSGSKLRLYGGGSGSSGNQYSDVLTTTKTTYTFYFVAGNATSCLIQLHSMGASNKVYVDNLSLKPVNGNPGLMTSMTASDIVTDTH